MKYTTSQFKAWGMKGGQSKSLKKQNAARINALKARLSKKKLNKHEKKVLRYINLVLGITGHKQIQICASCGNKCGDNAICPVCKKETK